MDATSFPTAILRVPNDPAHRFARGTATRFKTPMDRRIIPLIMCGGAGTRLWPASREGRPKQFLPLFGHALDLSGDAAAGIGCRRCSSGRSSSPTTHYRFMVPSSSREIGVEADILLEPMRRDSGPAIAAGAAFALTRDEDAVVLALAADHVVRDTAAFVAACREAADGGRGRAYRDVRRRAGTARD